MDDYESLLQGYYSKIVKRGDTVLDIGANVGRHTIPLSGRVGKNGKVLAFEPVPETRDTLSMNVSKRKNVSVFKQAVGDFNGETSFIKAVHSSGTMEESGIKRRQFNDEDNTIVEEILVQVTTIDSLENLDNLSFIKMDIEGGEIEALNGAKQTILKHRPYMAVEYGGTSYIAYNHDRDTLWELAKDLNYLMFDIYLNLIKDIDMWHNTVDKGTWDFILVPQEKLDKFMSLITK